MKTSDVVLLGALAVGGYFLFSQKGNVEAALGRITTPQFTIAPSITLPSITLPSFAPTIAPTVSVPSLPSLALPTFQDMATNLFGGMYGLGLIKPGSNLFPQVQKVAVRVFGGVA